MRRTEDWHGFFASASENAKVVTSSCNRSHSPEFKKCSVLFLKFLMKLNINLSSCIVLLFIEHYTFFHSAQSHLTTEPNFTCLQYFFSINFHCFHGLPYLLWCFKELSNYHYLLLLILPSPCLTALCYGFFNVAWAGYCNSPYLCASATVFFSD